MGLYSEQRAMKDAVTERRFLVELCSPGKKWYDIVDYTSQMQMGLEYSDFSMPCFHLLLVSSYRWPVHFITAASVHVLELVTLAGRLRALLEARDYIVECFEMST